VTARAVSKSVLSRNLAILEDRGTPARKIELRPDGKVFLHLVGVADETDSDKGVNPWDVVLADS